MRSSLTRPLLLSSLLLVASACATTGGASSPATAAQPAKAKTPWRARLVDPVTAPTTFETPVIHSSLNAMALHQNLPKASIFGGGDFQVYALQIRAALSERLAVIATKDGYIDFNPTNGTDESGFADIAAGLKYALIADEESGVLVTPGLVFENESGGRDVFQGNGDGMLRPFVSAGWDGGKLNVLGSLAYGYPLDDDNESAFLDYHLHADYEVAPGLFPLAELNGITYTSDGNRLPVSFEGGDLINLGSAFVNGNNLITGALGTRYQITDDLLLGLAYEWPLSDREDLMEDRITVDLLIFL